MIDQISRVITVVSLARTCLLRTPLATVSVHHIAPEFFFGFEMDAKTEVKMATPEKALLDVFYLKPAKSLRFKTPPEIEMPESFNAKNAFAMIERIPSASRRTIVAEALRALLAHS